MTRLVRYFLTCLSLAATCFATAQRSKTDTIIFHFSFDRSDVLNYDPTPLIGVGKSADSLLILGYTDTVGSARYNQRLSDRRAEAVRAGLHAYFATTPIRLEARGESDQVPGDDSLSRRALLIVYYHVKDTPAVIRPDTTVIAVRSENEPDTVISLDNINFVANTSVLTDDAKMALPKVAPSLRMFSDRYLEINGYCNQPGPTLKKTDPLFILSEHRAKFVYDYLVSQGFDSTHLRYVGRGNASPLNAHPVTREEMDQNMRVEIKVFRKLPPL